MRHETVALNRKNKKNILIFYDFDKLTAFTFPPRHIASKAH